MDNHCNGFIADKFINTAVHTTHLDFEIKWQSVKHHQTIVSIFGNKNMYPRGEGILKCKHNVR